MNPELDPMRGAWLAIAVGIPFYIVIGIIVWPVTP